MFYDCYKSDAGKLFVVSGDKKIVMQWQPESSWCIATGWCPPSGSFDNTFRK
jgi:hypothetical protein